MTTHSTHASARAWLTVALVAVLLVAMTLVPRPDIAQAAPHTITGTAAR